MNLNGRPRLIRTTEMTESKSVALPLGYGPRKFGLLLYVNNLVKMENGGGGQIRTAELGESGFTVHRV